MNNLLVKLFFSVFVVLMLVGCETTPHIFGVPTPYWQTLTDEQKQKVIEGYYSQPPVHSTPGYYYKDAYRLDTYDYIDDLHDELRIREAERRAEEAEESARRAEEAARSLRESQPAPTNNQDDGFYQPTKRCGQGGSGCRGL